MQNKKRIYFTNDKMKNLLQSDSYHSMPSLDNIDVDINHLENIFEDETYYAAMKIVPLLERKVLYLSYVENVRLNDICRRLKLQKKEVIALRNKGIIHFRNNLKTLEKAEKLKIGGKE